MKILWCGPFFSDLALKEKSAPNQAAAKWSRGLLRGLESVGCQIRVLDHCPEQRWPAGRVFWQDNSSRWFLDWFLCERVSYCNVWGVKDRWLCMIYARRVRKIVREWHPDVILCYNSLHEFNVIAMREAKRLGVKCVPIILDGDDPRRDDWKRLLKDNRFADGVVFLSWWMFQNYPDKSVPVYHMDGGAEGWEGGERWNEEGKRGGQCCQGDSRFTLVHTGALDYWRGLKFMQKVVRHCKRQDVRFVFCGKCDKTAMWAEFDNDPRVEVKGFLPNEKVDAICRDADVFLNVREPEIGDNVVNYPSKVPNYLCWGKPVVSTWMDSFSPDYNDVLEVCDNTPDGFVCVLDRVLAWDTARKASRFEKTRDWFLNHKPWNRQAKGLVNWIHTEVCQ